MALPLLLPAIAGIASKFMSGGGSQAGVMGAVSGAVKKATGIGLEPKRRRRRRRRLTNSEIIELTNIKNILGKTAAASALPYYLGRGN